MVSVEVVEEEPEPEPTQRPVREGWDDLLIHYFGSEWQRAKAVMMCESGGRENALGDTHLTYWQNGREWGSSAGLFQIRDLPGRPEQSWLMVGENNIAYAAQMQRAQSWAPWTCARKLGIH